MATAKQLIEALNKSAKETIGGVGLNIPDPPRLPSGNFALDLAIGGGIPLGRVTEIYGIEAAMKTTLLLKLIAQHQRMFPERRCAFIDVEGHTPRSWMETFGVDWSQLLYVSPDNGEQIVDLMEGLIQAEDIGLVGLDSIAAMISQRELDADAETANVGTSGLLVNKMYRKCTHALNKAKRDGKTLPTLVFINQIRYKMGVMHGDPETTPGGPAIKFFASMRLRVSGTDTFLKPKTDKLPTYKHIRGTVKKHKVPILAKAFEYQIALRDIPELNLKFGESYDWNTVLLYLKKLGLLLQVKDGWELQALVAGAKVTYPTQEALKERYQADRVFGDKVRKAVIDTALKNGDPITETENEGEG